MNPDRTKGGMTVNALMQTGVGISIAIAVICIATLAFVSAQLMANTSGTFFLVILAAAIVAVLGIIITNYIVQRKIKDRLLGLVDACRDYAGGDRTVRASVTGDDDFAMLAMSLNTLLDTQGSVTGGPSLNSSSSSDAVALQAQIEKLLQEVSAVGDGDLRVQAEVTPDTLGVLADSFNYMIEELAKVVGRVQATAGQVTNATRRILDRSAELAQASETQVAQISQTTEAVEALATFIQGVARNAQMSVEAAQEALRNATSGQQAVRQTINGMVLIRENVQETSKKIKRLGERSNEISEIIRIIEDIADQTNLLALNAAIQSAMAGEHGRGFAVVADEIRLLAERSTESTKRIATLVKSIQGDTYEAVVAMEDSTQEVVKGSQLADEAGNSLNSIYKAVERQAQMIENIARSANEQAPVSDAVANAMTQISEITRQTNDGTQEAAINVSYLAELSEQLRASVSTFQLPERGNEMIGSFSPVTSITEMSASHGGQVFSTLGAGMENTWGQDFAGNFPPLPEPNNADSLVALSSPSYGFNNAGQSNFFPARNQQHSGNQPYYQGQPRFAPSNGNSQPPFGNPSPFNSQGFPTGNGQQGYVTNGSNQSGQQNFGAGQFNSQQNFSNQNSGGYSNGQQFSQFEFGEMGAFDDQQGYNGQQFDMPGNFGPQGFPQAIQQQMPPSSHQGSMPPALRPGQAVPTRPPRRPGIQQGQQGQQGQQSYNQDSFPFQNNG